MSAADKGKRRRPTARAAGTGAGDPAPTALERPNASAAPGSEVSAARRVSARRKSGPETDPDPEPRDDRPTVVPPAMPPPSPSGIAPALRGGASIPGGLPPVPRLLSPRPMAQPTALELTLHSRGDLRRLGHRLASCLEAGDLVLLEGELGAGKTFLARAIARGLGVPPEVRVTSPTFDLVHELPARVPLVHVDLYRIDAASDLLELGLLDRIGSDAILLIEWGARFATDLGGQAIRIQLERGADPGRRGTIAALGTRGAQLLARVAAALETRGIHGPRCAGSAGQWRDQH